MLTKNDFIQFICRIENSTIFALTKKAHFLIARVAELVDALVSNTNDSNIVPVRSRPRVHFQYEAL
jgi:hypothetical protein